MRFVVEYTKEERVKYISHLDLMRSMQRAIRRAELPIAWSRGYHPHPVMAFASALPVGMTSEGEYMDIHLLEEMDVPGLEKRLNKALPKGITVKQAVSVDEKVPSLMCLVERADYRIVPDDPEWDWKPAVDAFWSKPEIWVEKKSKKKVSSINLKEAVRDIRACGEHNRELFLSLPAGSSGNLKPDLVVDALLEEKDRALSFCRTGLYLRKDGKWVTPLALGKQEGGIR